MPVVPPAPMHRQHGMARGRLLLVIALLLVVVLAAAAGAYFFLHHGAAPKPGAARAPEPVAAPVFVKIDPFTVNLADDSGRVLYVGLSLAAGNDAAVTQLNDYMPQVRNRILMVLSDQHADTLITAQGKKDLAARLAQTVRQPYDGSHDPLPIRDVLFTDFIVQ